MQWCRLLQWHCCNGSISGFLSKTYTCTRKSLRSWCATKRRGTWTAASTRSNSTSRTLSIGLADSSTRRQKLITTPKRKRNRSRFSTQRFELKVNSLSSQWRLAYFITGSITVLLASCLTGLDLIKLVNLCLIQHKQSSWILTSQTGGQLYSDASPYEVSYCSLV